MGKVEQLVSYFLFPVLLFHAIVKTPSNLGSASSLIGAGWALCATGIALAYALPHLPWLKTHIDSCQHTACAQIAFRFISFFALALALAERLAGAQGLALIAILLEVRVPVLNVAAVWPMTRHANHQIGRTLIANPLILATLSGMLANLAGFSIPDWLVPTVTRLGAASLALGLMAAGAGLGLIGMAQAKTLGVAVLSITHLAMPLAAWVLAAWFGLSPVQTTILQAYSAVPTATSAYVLATPMGYDDGPVAAMVTLSTRLGCVSLPLAIELRNL